MCRERAVLTRQLQEAKMALDDVKTSWSGQIASLETQVSLQFCFNTACDKKENSTTFLYIESMLIFGVIFFSEFEIFHEYMHQNVVSFVLNRTP